MSLVPWDRKEIAAAAVVAVAVAVVVAVVAAGAVVGINTRLHHLEVPSFSPVKAISSPDPPPDPHRRWRSHPLEMGNTVISKSYNTHHPIHLPTTSLSRRPHSLH